MSIENADGSVSLTAKRGSRLVVLRLTSGASYVEIDLSMPKAERLLTALAEAIATARGSEAQT